MTALIPTYKERFTPLHRAQPWAAVFYLLAIAVFSFAFTSPVVVTAMLVVVLVLAWRYRVLIELRAMIPLAAILALSMALLNPIVTREGLTVVFRGPSLPIFGPIDITMEAVVYGLVVGLRLAAVVLALVLFSAVVNPDGVFKLLRRLGLRSVLATSVAVRLLPIAARDQGRLRDALGCRGDRRSDKITARERVLLLQGLVANSLERGLDIAAALELRGVGNRGWRPYSRPARSSDYVFGGCAVILVALMLSAKALAVGDADFYPLLANLVTGSDLIFAAAAALVALLPLLLIPLIDPIYKGGQR